MTGVQRVSAARKPWRCSMCVGRIEVGEPYVRIRRINRPVVVTHAPGKCRDAGSTVPSSAALTKEGERWPSSR